jgi:hypothetical protein
MGRRWMIAVGVIAVIAILHADHRQRDAWR